MHTVVSFFYKGHAFLNDVMSEDQEKNTSNRDCLWTLPHSLQGFPSLIWLALVEIFPSLHCTCLIAQLILCLVASELSSPVSAQFCCIFAVTKDKFGSFLKKLFITSIRS